MSKAHIRDFLAVSMEDYKAGKVSTTTLCGLQDPQMNTLCFGDPEAIEKKKINSFCEICRNKWVNEAESRSDQKRAIHKFRKIVHGATSLSRFRK